MLTKMKYFLIILFSLPLSGRAHPGIGIVLDSKNNVYYSDLRNVWKIRNGVQTLLIPNVHTHELYIDANDKLYGEDGYYDSALDKHFHYLWSYRPHGQFDTIVSMRENYIQIDFSLTRDKFGNEYYLKRFIPPYTDHHHIYKRSLKGIETVFAEGDFKDVNWLYPQTDGGILYISQNTLYRVDVKGHTQIVKDKIGNAKPSFKFSGDNITIWSAWEDKTGLIYVAVFSDQEVKRIDLNGNLTTVYTSSENWTPLHGVFDKNNKLWILEGSDQNEMRVIEVTVLPLANNKVQDSPSTYLWLGLFALILITLFIILKKFK